MILPTYDGNDNVLTDKAVLPSGAFQTTQYIRDAQRSAGSDLNSKDLLTEVRFPDKTSGDPGTNAADKRTFKYNAVGQMKQYTDQNQTVHDYTYDVLGRPLDDKASTLGGGVDGRVRRVSTTYATGGQRAGLSSNDAVTGGNAVTSVPESASDPFFRTLFSETSVIAV